MINKDVRKLLAHKKGNKILIWIWSNYDAQNAKEWAYLISLVQSHPGSTTANFPQPATATPDTPAIILQYILKHTATSGLKWHITAQSLEGRKSLNYHINHISSLLIYTSVNPDEESRTNLDLHDNVVVVGMHANILNYTGCTTEVSPFMSSYDALKMFLLLTL